MNLVRDFSAAHWEKLRFSGEAGSDAARRLGDRRRHAPACSANLAHEIHRTWCEETPPFRAAEESRPAPRRGRIGRARDSAAHWALCASRLRITLVRGETRQAQKRRSALPVVATGVMAPYRRTVPRRGRRFSALVSRGQKRAGTTWTPGLLAPIKSPPL